MTHYATAGRAQTTVRSDVELMRDAFVGEFASFVDAVRTGKEPYVTEVDASRALAIALACIGPLLGKTPNPVMPYASNADG